MLEVCYFVFDSLLGVALLKRMHTLRNGDLCVAPGYVCVVESIHPHMVYKMSFHGRLQTLTFCTRFEVRHTNAWTLQKLLVCTRVSPSSSDLVDTLPLIHDVAEIVVLIQISAIHRTRPIQLLPIMTDER